MKWLPSGRMAIEREDGRYMINRAPEQGFPAVYMLVKLGRRVTTERGTMWDGSTIIDTARAENESERRDVVERLKGLCDA